MPLDFSIIKTSNTVMITLGIGNGVPANTPSVSNESSSGGGGSASSGSARIAGMFFYHPDHLGSITMITDGNGNVLAGGERGGKSHITYKPYGEILRTDSYGPDITKFKYTGQEEDRESGLYYYKARYYDANLGRFISSDNVTFPHATSGMNRHMYVFGNPLSLNDPTGNTPSDISLQDQMIFTAYFYKYLSRKSTGLNAPNTPGHNYSGSGSKDSFDDFFNKDKAQVGVGIFKTIIALLAYNRLNGNTESLDQVFIKALIFGIFVAPYLRATPKSRMDKVSQTHDDSASTGLLTFSGPGDDRRHSRGASYFVKDSFKAIGRPSKLNAGDIVTFGIGVPLYSHYGLARGMGADLARMNKWNISDGASFMAKAACVQNTMCAVGASLLGNKNLGNVTLLRKGRFKGKL